MSDMSSRAGIYRARVHFHRYMHGGGIVLTFKEITRTSFVGNVAHARRASLPGIETVADPSYIATLRQDKHKFMQLVAAMSPYYACCIEANNTNNTITRLWCNSSFATRLKLDPDEVVGTQMSPERNPELPQMIVKLSQITEGTPLTFISPNSLFGSDDDDGADREYMITVFYVASGENSNIRRYVTFTTDTTVELKRMSQEREDQLLMMNTIFENHSIVMAAVDVDFERRDFTYVVANNALSSYYSEFDEKSLVGAHAVDMHRSQKEIDQWVDLFSKAKQTAKTIKYEIVVRDRVLDTTVVHLHDFHTSPNRFVYFGGTLTVGHVIYADVLQHRIYRR